MAYCVSPKNGFMKTAMISTRFANKKINKNRMEQKVKKNYTQFLKLNKL
jgi:hypothetical protein